MNKSLLVLLGILVVLVVVYLLVNSARDVTRQPQAFIDVDTTDIDGILIKKGDDETELKRSGSGWRIAQPIDYPAEGHYVTDLMKKIDEMAIENLVTTDADKDTLYGFDDTTTVEVTVLGGGKDLAHFLVGRTTESNRHTYCRKVGDDSIYRVRGTFTSQLNRKTKDWRDKKILELDREAISRIDYEYPRETFSLVKADTVWMLEIGTTSEYAEDRFVNQVVSLVSRFRTFDFVDRDSARAVDFSVPDLMVTIYTDVGDSYKLSLVPQDKEENRYLVKKEGLENTLFVIYKGTANALMKHPDDFRPVEKDQT